MRIVIFLLTFSSLTSCEYTVDGRLRNRTADTLKVRLIVDLENRKKSYMYFDSLTYEQIVRKDGFKDLKTSWNGNKLFEARFKILPKDSIWLFGGLGPASSNKIYFDTLIIVHRNDARKYFEREDIFKNFRQFGSKYRIDVE